MPRWFPPSFCMSLLQGCLDHKKDSPPRTLQYDSAQGPMVVLGGGKVFMSEVTLYTTCFSHLPALRPDGFLPRRALCGVLHLIDSGLVGLTDFWDGYRESRRYSRDTHPDSYITNNTGMRRLIPTPCTGHGHRGDSDLHVDVAPHKALKSIAWGKMTFNQSNDVHRTGYGDRGDSNLHRHAA